MLSKISDLSNYFIIIKTTKPILSNIYGDFSAVRYPWIVSRKRLENDLL